MTDQREGLRVRKLAGEPGSGLYHRDHITGEPAKYPLAGVQFVDTQGLRSDVVPKQITVPHDYVDREPWIELVGVTAAVRPAGPAENPWAKKHNFTHVEELILHTVHGDLRYKVVRQPDKYGADGQPINEAGVPADVYWAYDADLIEEN